MIEKNLTIDPIRFQQELWPSTEYTDYGGQQHPGVRFYSKQREIIYSVEDNVETLVPAGNKLGVSPRS
jgi:hypothetical protein